MDYRDAFVKLVAYCQQEGLLSPGYMVVYELSNITDMSIEDIEEALD